MIGLWLIYSGTALGQHFGKGHGSGFGPGSHNWEKREKSLENLRLLKLLEILELNDEQNDRFIAAFSSFRNKLRNIHDSVQLEIENVIEILHGDLPDEEKIMQTVDRVQELQRRRWEAADYFHDKVKTILTPVQLGKLLAFEERFEREMMKELRQFRDRNAPPGDPDIGP
jgi:Spy/CpxP family protein refolding chaperone